MHRNCLVHESISHSRERCLFTSAMRPKDRRRCWPPGALLGTPIPGDQGAGAPSTDRPWSSLLHSTLPGRAPREQALELRRDILRSSTQQTLLKWVAPKVALEMGSLVIGRRQERVCWEGSGFEARQGFLGRDSARLTPVNLCREVPRGWQSSLGYSMTSSS